ncbi:MAG: ATP cone domain-containing protein, partial [Candidatus Uhrbacteria bacterium]|nr:ATP cone domain-containing protein [Candidatus Uhrbacteria bacterium]
MMIRKASGELAEFSLEKLRDSVVRAGATGEAALRVANTVLRHVVDGMSTKRLHELVKAELARDNVCVACRYSLRDGLARLGPSGFHFEEYLAALLGANGYTTTLPEEYQGACVLHEVDVDATYGRRRCAIEAKFRNDYRDYVRLRDVLVAYARFLDLVDGASRGTCPTFTEVWVATNGKFSDRAMTYAACKDMKLVGWNYPKGEGLESMVSRSGLYPVTVMSNLTEAEIEHLAAAKLMLCQDVATQDAEQLAERLDVSLSRAEELVRLA